MAATSTAPIRPAWKRDTGYFNDGERVTFDYTDPAHFVSLPDCGWVWIQLQEGKIKEIYVIPQLGPKSWEETEALIERAVAALERAGWKRRPRGGWTLPELSDFYHDRSKDRDRQVFGIWDTDSVFAEVDVDRGERASGGSANPSPIRRDLFSISISFEPRDSALERDLTPAETRPDRRPP